MEGRNPLACLNKLGEEDYIEKETHCERDKIFLKVNKCKSCKKIEK